MPARSVNGVKKHFTSAPGQRNGDVFARDATRKYHAVGPLHVACVDSLHLRQTRQVVKTKAHTEVQFPLLSQATSNGDCAKSRPQRVRREMTNRETPQSRRPRTTSSREDSRGFEAAPWFMGGLSIPSNTAMKAVPHKTLPPASNQALTPSPGRIQ